MRYAVIDTESNGLFTHRDRNGGVVRSDSDGQPRLASFSMILLNDDLSVQEQYSALVRPDGWQMTPEATAVNGLTDERLAAEGLPVADVLAVYSQAIAEGFAMAAFNAQHDLRQMRGELRRAGLPDLFTETKNVCLMRKSAGVIPRPDGKKTWPKLDHCRLFFSMTGDDSHTAPGDAAVAVEVLRHLLGAGVDLTPEVHFAKGGDKPQADEGGVQPAPMVPDAPISRPSAAQAALPLADQELPT